MKNNNVITIETGENVIRIESRQINCFEGAQIVKRRWFFFFFLIVCPCLQLITKYTHDRGGPVLQCNTYQRYWPKNNTVLTDNVHHVKQTLQTLKPILAMIVIKNYCAPLRSYWSVQVHCHEFIWPSRTKYGDFECFVSIRLTYCFGPTIIIN